MQKLVLILLALTFSHATPEASDNFDLLIKARGLQGLEKLEELVKKNGDSQGANLSQKELCEWKLNSVYAAFATPSLSKTVINKGKNETVYKLLFASEKKGFTQVNFFLKKDATGKITDVSIPEVKDGDQVIVSTKKSGSVTVINNKCIYVFPLSNIIQAQAYPSP